MRPYLTIFVPAYNEQANLEHTLIVLRSKMRELNTLWLEPGGYEVLIVDDGSQDATGSIADELARRWHEVRVAHHKTNRGLGAAFLTARDLASGEWFILIPADLALEIDDLEKYLQGTREADIIVGLRSDRRDYTFMRKLISRANIYLLQTLFRMHIHQFQYISMYKTDLLQNIAIDYWRSAFFLAEILIKARDLGAILREIRVRYVARKSGRATGAQYAQVLRTVGDIFHYWFRWLAKDRQTLSMRRKP